MSYDSALLERVAQRFRRDMWNSVVPEAVTESGVQVARFGPVQATAFGDLPEERRLHQIQGAAEPGAIECGHLARAVEWMRAREVDYRVPVAESRPGATDADAWLGERGFERDGGSVKLVRAATLPKWPEDPDVQVFELGLEEADGEGLSTIVTEALELPCTTGTLLFSLPQQPHWLCYTAALDPVEGVVAAAAMMIEDGVAQLGLGTTLVHARGRGCHRALLRRRLVDAARAGCHTVFVELGEGAADRSSSAYRNLRGAGFEEAYGSHVWQRPALHPAEWPEPVW